MSEELNVQCQACGKKLQEGDKAVLLEGSTDVVVVCMDCAAVESGDDK